VSGAGSGFAASPMAMGAAVTIAAASRAAIVRAILPERNDLRARHTSIRLTFRGGTETCMSYDSSLWAVCTEATTSVPEGFREFGWDFGRRSSHFCTRIQFHPSARQQRSCTPAQNDRGRASAVPSAKAQMRYERKRTRSRTDRSVRKSAAPTLRGGPSRAVKMMVVCSVCESSGT
jgi:hypothetical protein